MTPIISLRDKYHHLPCSCHLSQLPRLFPPKGKARRQQQWESPAASPAGGQPAPLQPVSFPLTLGWFGLPAPVLPTSVPAHLLPTVRRPLLPPRRPVQPQLHTPVAFVEPAAAGLLARAAGGPGRTREGRTGESNLGP